MLGGVILLVVAVIAVSVLMNEKKTEKQNPGKAQTISYRPDFHFSSPDKWKNDPQQPIYYQGKYHYYYLYNKDYPEGNGTEWRHATSEDLIHWKIMELRFQNIRQKTVIHGLDLSFTIRIIQLGLVKMRDCDCDTANGKVRAAGTVSLVQHRWRQHL